MNDFRHPDVLESDAVKVPTPKRRTSRAFFIDAHFDECGGLLGLEVVEHGPEKNADDERGLSLACAEYFEAKRKRTTA